jgi:FkbM family methyltransferase
MINVCFSTIPPRFSNLDLIIQSFKEQVIVPDRVIIVVPEEYHRFSYDKSEIISICEKYNNFVHLMFVEKDYGPATKVYGAIHSLELYPDSYVMVCDDDAIYHTKLVESYFKAIQHDSECAWTPVKSIEHNANDLKLPTHHIHKLQGVDTYLFYPKILNKINSNNFEQKYYSFLSKNTDIKQLSDVFLHDDYFVSCLLYDENIPIKTFYLVDTVYEGISGENQIHESLKCHSDEVELIQRVYQTYENSHVIIRCDFTRVNGEKIGEYWIHDKLNTKEYHNYIIHIYENYGAFKIAININPEVPMNTLLDRKATELEELYHWQIRYSQMPDDHIDYLFRLKYWNNFYPKVVYDIGSNYLSWSRLVSNVWRDAKIYCVDACPEFANVYPKYGIDYAIEVLSDKAEQIEFWENPMCPGLCTMYPVNEIHDPGRNFHNEHLRKVIRQTKTLDELAREKNWLKPDLIKIDVQGAEVNILEGASEVIKGCNHIILEVQTKEFSTGAPMLDDVEKYMNSIGFSLFYKIGHNDSKCDGDYHFVRSNILPK